MPSLFRTLIQVAAGAYIYWGFKALDSTEMNTFVENQAGGHYQFLTICGLMLSLATLAFGVLDGLTSLFAPNFLLFRALQKIFLLVALPIEATISSIYWPIILTVPHLMLPPANKETSNSDPTEPTLYFIPLSMDLALHAAPALALAFDFFVFERAYRRPISSWGAIILTGAFAASYAVWVERCAKINGTFPYPFLTLSDFPTRCAIYVGASVLGLLSFWTINGLKQMFEGSAGKAKTA